MQLLRRRRPEEPAQARRRATSAFGLVTAWREAPYYTDAERAALELAEAATRLADRDDAVPDEVWDNAAGHFDERQLASILLMTAVTNLFNRPERPDPPGRRQLVSTAPHAPLIFKEASTCPSSARHRYSVADAGLEEFLARRSSLIATVREGHPGLSRAVLIRLDDGTYTDTWYWESAGQLDPPRSPPCPRSPRRR
ncbi:hypothetical protein [Streptosporangium vulgare]|uniref:hypothetical protein n=1 Tax=Streptosporangium vulgare TaxID=46190 RepID=UPI0031D12E9D